MPRIYGEAQRPVPLPPALYQRALVRYAIQAGLVRSQAELARRIGTTESNLSRWLAGRQPRARMAYLWMEELQNLEHQLARGARLRPSDWEELWNSTPADARARMDLASAKAQP